MGRLFTHEDRYQIHKSLGLYCSLHFMYRLYQLITIGTMGWGPLHIESVIPHLVLPFTSFLFHVPRKRIETTMIWEEMRFHSVIFNTRSILVFMTASWQSRTEVKLFMILICHLVADWFTLWYGTPGLSTIRVKHNSDDPAINRIVKGWYSFSQIMATATLIQPNYNMDLSFSIMIGITYAAFLMTLKRKDYISKRTYNIGYLISLLIVAVVIWYHLGLIQFKYGLILYILRTNRFIPFNKYALWVAYSILILY